MKNIRERGIKMGELIKFRNVKKTYNIGEKNFNALDGIDFTINKGEFVVILRTIRSRKIYLIKFTSVEWIKLHQEKLS